MYIYILRYFVIIRPKKIWYNYIYTFFRSRDEDEVAGFLRIFTKTDEGLF